MAKPQSFLTRKEVLALFQAGELKVGDCFAYDEAYESWMTVTSVTPWRYDAIDQLGREESVARIQDNG